MSDSAIDRSARSIGGCRAAVVSLESGC